MLKGTTSYRQNLVYIHHKHDVVSQAIELTSILATCEDIKYFPLKQVVCKKHNLIVTMQVNSFLYNRYLILC